MEEELGNEFDNLTDEESSQSSEEDAADDGTFGRFLKGIANPREEFPEDESLHDVRFRYNLLYRFKFFNFYFKTKMYVFCTISPKLRLS